MLKYFKTKYSLAHPLTYFENDLFNHPIGVSEKSRSQICRFGRDGSWFLALFIILKCFAYNKKLINKDTMYGISRIVLLAVFILSLMNFNAVVYLIPFFIHESKYFLN